MKANELMVGDLIKTNSHSWNDETLENKYCKVEMVGQNYLRCLLIDNPERQPYGEGTSFEPIPLTPEVLARMGFTIEEIPKYDDTYTEDEYIATIKCVDNKKCEVEIEYKTYWKKLMAFNYDPHNRLGFTSMETQIEYVHELQHIMRLCGIGKEIVL